MTCRMQKMPINVHIVRFQALCVSTGDKAGNRKKPLKSNYNGFAAKNSERTALRVSSLVLSLAVVQLHVGL